MSTKQKIIIGYYHDGKSRRQLAKELGINRRTVNRYLKNHFRRYGEQLPDSGIEEVPKYDTSNRRKVKLTEQVRALIDEQLELNAEKRRTGRSKLILKGTDIHAMLRERGYDISYPTVVNYVRLKKDQGNEAFIRQEYLAGESTEFDWGEVRLDLDGKESRLMLAVFTCAYSNYRWARLYFRQDMCSFLHAHAMFFEHTGGVSREVVYDNMRTAVAKFAVRAADKEPTDDLLRLSVYYGFNYRFCNARSGNEKGRVERSVEVVRRKVFGRKSSFADLARANRYLAAAVDRHNAETKVKGKQQTILERFEQERRVMIPAPTTAFDAGIPGQFRVNKYSCIQVDNNYYSVPDNLVGRYVDVKIYPHQIKVYLDDNQVFTHQRQTTQFQYYLKIEHYLPTLRRKPGALRRSVTLRQSDEVLKRIFENYFENRPKDFVELLSVLHPIGQAEKTNRTPAELHAAIEKCLRICPHQAPQLDKIKYFLTQPSTVKSAPMSADKSGKNSTGTLTQPSENARQESDSIARQSRRQLQLTQALFNSS